MGDHVNCVIVFLSSGIRVFQRTCQVTQRSDDASVGYVLGI